MPKNFFGRVSQLWQDCLLSFSAIGPSLRLVFDRKYMAAWHTFCAFDSLAVKILIDIGAHDGLYAKRAARYFSLERTVLIEPLPEKGQLLRGLGLPGMCVLEAALADREGTAKFTINATSQASSIKKVNSVLGGDYGFDLSEVGTIDVKLTTLDAVFDKLQLTHADLVKIDVQGAERELLRGAQKALTNIRFIQIEMLFADHYADSADFCELYQTLRAAGFRLARLQDFTHAPTGVLLHCDAVFVNERYLENNSR